MKRAWSRIAICCALLILPVLMTLLSLEIKRDQGPYWAGAKVDPSYSYLLGSLAYAVGKPSMCCLHPGVTVQIDGAWVLRLTHSVIGQDDLVIDVLRNPEIYASILGFEEILLYAFAMGAAGWMVYRSTRRLDLALIMQTPVFFSDSTFLWLSPIAPEAILYGIAILASALAVVYSLKPDAPLTKFIPVALGILSGAGLATKITYLPVALMPLILLESWPGLIGYLCAASLSFAWIAIPHWKTVDEALYFWTQLLHRQGLHGTGAEGHPYLADLAATTGQYFRSDPFFALMLFSCFAFTAWLFALRARLVPKRLLIALTLGELAQVVLASRQFNLRYVSPAYALLAAHAVVILFCFRPLAARRRRLAMLGCIAVIFLLVAYRSAALHRAAGEFREQRKAGQAVVRRTLEARPGTIPIAYYGANTIPFALHFGDVWVYRAFARQLEDLYPKMLFWDAYRRTFENFTSPVAVENLVGCNRLLLRGTPFGLEPMNFSPPDGVSVTEIDRFGAEAFYSMNCKADVKRAP